MQGSTCALAGCLRRTLLTSACLLWAVVPGSAGDGLSVLDQASTLKAAGNYDGAISVLRAFIARDSGEAPLVLAKAWNDLAAAYHVLGLCGESKTAYRRAFRLCEQAGDPDAIIIVALNFAAALHDCSAHKQVADLVRRVLEPRMGEFTPLLRARTLLLLAYAQMHRRKYGDADSLFREALALLQREDPVYRAEVLNGLAANLSHSGRKPEAIVEMRRALALLDEAGGPPCAFRVPILSNLANLCHDLGRYEEAETAYLAALATATAAFGETDNPTAGLVLIDYANHLRARGRRAEAKNAKQQAQAILANTRSHGTVDIEDLRAESGKRR
jgi:tetratricopeptide (TPR) repeat protein